MPFEKGNTYWKNNIGRKATKETRRKLRESIKKAYKKGLKFGFPKDHDGFKNSGQFKKGHRPWNYINGKTRYRKYGKKKWIKLAKKTYERDNWECQDCGKKGGILNAHHIKFAREFPTLEFEMNNLITLCVNCHNKVHGWRNKND